MIGQALTIALVNNLGAVMHVIMAGDNNGGPIVRTNIYLTVAGLSKCVGFEAYAALSLIPGFGGAGISISIDMPISVEACGVTSTGLEDEVEIRVRGPGLPYTSPDVPIGLEAAAEIAYSEGTLDAEKIALRLPDYIIAPDAVVSSIAGSSAFIAGKIYKLSSDGLWTVIVKLRRPLQTERVLLKTMRYRSILDALAIMFIDDIIEASKKHSHIYPAILGINRYTSAIDDALSAGALAATIDAYASKLIAFTEDLDTALEVLLALNGYGSGIYARLEA